jgi:hypothetical protein
VSGVRTQEGSIHYASQPVDICFFDRIWFEEVMWHQSDAAFSQCFWRFSGPNFISTLLDHGWQVLHNILQVGIYRKELKSKAACEEMSISPLS